MRRGVATFTNVVALIEGTDRREMVRLALTTLGKGFTAPGIFDWK